MAACDVFGAELDADDIRHLADEGRIPCRGQADRLGKHCGFTSRGDAVQPFIPPIIFPHAQARDRGRVIDQVRGFFLERHAADQIGGARFGAERDIAIGRWRRLREGGARGEDKQTGEEEGVHPEFLGDATLTAKGGQK